MEYCHLISILPYFGTNLDIKIDRNRHFSKRQPSRENFQSGNCEKKQKSDYFFSFSHTQGSGKILQSVTSLGSTLAQVYPKLHRQKQESILQNALTTLFPTHPKMKRVKKQTDLKYLFFFCFFGAKLEGIYLYGQALGETQSANLRLHKDFSNQLARASFDLFFSRHTKFR